MKLTHTIITLATIRQQMMDMECKIEQMMLVLDKVGATDSKSEGHTTEVVMEMNSLVNHMTSVRQMLFNAQV